MEKRVVYKTGGTIPLQRSCKPDIVSTEVDVLHGRLRHIKIQLLSLLVEIDRALGDEPSVITRAERRRR